MIIVMGIEIRHAIPDDAESIHRLIVNHQLRLRQGKPTNQPATTVSVDQVRHRLEYPSHKMQRMVALGNRGKLLAMLQMGVWNVDRENEFTPTRWGRFLNGLHAEWPEHYGLYSFALRDGLAYSHPAARGLAVESRVFSIEPGQTLYAPLATTPDGAAIDPNYQTLLAQNGMRTTDRTGLATVPGLVRTPYLARLMAKHRS